jgi:hypothetical protein
MHVYIAMPTIRKANGISLLIQPEKFWVSKRTRQQNENQLFRGVKLCGTSSTKAAAAAATITTATTNGNKH